jgi:hypothetical protein
MQIHYIAKMQDNDKLLTQELKKSDHKYELTRIERTSEFDTEWKHIYRDGN